MQVFISEGESLITVLCRCRPLVEFYLHVSSLLTTCYIKGIYTFYDAGKIDNMAMVTGTPSSGFFPSQHLALPSALARGCFCPQLTKQYVT